MALNLPRLLNASSRLALNYPWPDEVSTRTCSGMCDL